MLRQAGEPTTPVEERSSDRQAAGWIVIGRCCGFGSLLLLAWLSQTACSHAQSRSWDRIIENLDLTETLRLDGPEWNNTLVRNVTIHDTPDGAPGIFLRDVQNVRIESSTIRDIDGMGILLSGTGGTENVTIAGNIFRSIAHHGIHAAQREDTGVDHDNVQILDNTISQIGAGGDGHTHGIYVQAQEFLIEGNTLTDIVYGNGISVRSSGVVRDNVVDGAGKSAIAYFSDHMHGPSDKLVIEGNEVDNAGLHFTDRAGIDLLTVAQQSKGYPVQSYEIRNNILHGEGVQVHPDYQRYGYDVTLADNKLDGVTSHDDVQYRLAISQPRPPYRGRLCEAPMPQAAGDGAHRSLLRRS